MNLIPKKNNIGVGLAIGLITPVAGYLVLMSIFSLIDDSGSLDSVVSMSTMFRERTLSICAIALNALFMKRYDKWRYTETMRGIVLPTFVYVIIWIIYFKDIILP
ncbi:MAG: hypothetical protein P8P48_09155 [Saprospiraceae bacterium]|nr:hypothetical protein [Saprospiraceae bacterium]